MGEEKKRILKVKDLIIHADNVQIIRQHPKHDHHHQVESSESSESHRRGSWDWFWGHRNTPKHDDSH